MQQERVPISAVERIVGAKVDLRGCCGSCGQGLHLIPQPGHGRATMKRWLLTVDRVPISSM